MDKDRTHNYDDIIQLPHPTSTKHPRMSLYDRAAQFSPYAALTGHEEAIEETARLTQEKMELDDDEKERLNKKLQMLQENRNKDILVTITYFSPDERKEGGTYVSYTGRVKKIDGYKQTLIMKDNTVIPLEQIREIESELFCELGQ